MAPWEDEADFAAFAADLFADLAPAGACEEALAQRIALCTWRLERICRIEADLLMSEGAAIADAAALAPPVGAWPAEMAALTRYEGTLDRALERAMKLLRERQKLRLADALPDALAVSTERTQFAVPSEPAPAVESALEAPPAPTAEPEERSQSAGLTEADLAERSQFDAAVAAELTERSQFADADDDEDEEDLPSPQELIARREAERLERARLINESCRPKGRPVPA